MSPSEKTARDAAPPDPQHDVTWKRGVGKTLARAPASVIAAFEDLVADIQDKGPVQSDWPHYSQLKGQKGQKPTEKRHHCWLQGGRPTYVACWQEIADTIQIEIYYAGTHENAPY